MGNFLARKSPLVHPSDPHQLSHLLDERNRSPGTFRVKVRMTARDFNELLTKADPAGKGDGDIGHLVLRECLRGNCHARVIGPVKSYQDDGKDIGAVQKVRHAMKITISENQAYLLIKSVTASRLMVHRLSYLSIDIPYVKSVSA